MFRSLSISVVLVFLSITALAQTAVTGSEPCAEFKTRADRAETRLKDWPQLARYHDDNAKVMPPAKNEQRVVFMGDSIKDDYFSAMVDGKGFLKDELSDD